jgi:hypothetical protein
MKNKNLCMVILVIMLVFGMTGTGAFAQEENKHQPFDVLIGLNSGFGMTPNMATLYGDLASGKIPKGNYAFIMDFGITGDFYLFSWLSFNSGLLLHPDIYVLLEQDFIGKEDLQITDIAFSPLCLTIPITAHVNIPNVEWLYVGMGFNLNFPLIGLADSVAASQGGVDIDTKGDFFIGLPIDIGFDLIKPGKGGGRFFFRITPEFHKNGTTVPIGFIWQIWNWKI